MLWAAFYHHLRRLYSQSHAISLHRPSQISTLSSPYSSPLPRGHQRLPHHDDSHLRTIEKELLISSDAGCVDGVHDLCGEGAKGRLVVEDQLGEGVVAEVGLAALEHGGWIVVVVGAALGADYVALDVAARVEVGKEGARDGLDERDVLRFVVVFELRGGGAGFTPGEDGDAVGHGVFGDSGSFGLFGCFGLFGLSGGEEGEFSWMGSGGDGGGGGDDDGVGGWESGGGGAYKEAGTYECDESRCDTHFLGFLNLDLDLESRSAGTRQTRR
jgi:hypothetical protein